MVVHRFKKGFQIGLLAMILLVVGLNVWGGFPLAWAEELKWKEEIFDVTFVDADVRDVLTDVLKRNGKTAVFLPGVTGTVTFDFRSNPMPIEAAFNKILAENNLTHMFDAANKAVKVMPASASAISDDLFTPKYSDLKSILDAFARFGLGSGVTITADHITNVLFFHGTQADVATLKRVATEIDESMQNMQARRLKDTEQQSKELEQQRLKHSVSVEEQRAQLEKDKIEDERSVTVEVIPLRYTSVAPSTTSFLGEKITLPGILDSLRAFVGPITVLDASKDESEDKGVKEAKHPAPTDTRNKPLVSVDVRTNSIVVQGSPTQIKRVADVVKKLDKEVPLIEIEVMVVAGSVDTSKSFGVQLGVTSPFGANANLLIPSDKGTLTNLGFTPANPATNPTILQDQFNVAQATDALNAAKARTDAGAGAAVSAAQTAMNVANANLAHATANASVLPTKQGLGQLMSTQGGLGAQFLYRGTREVLESAITAMASDGKAHKVASPRVVTLNNLAAHVSNTTKITNLAVNSVTIGNQSSSSQGQSSSAEAGTTLVIIPSVIKTEEEDGSRLVRMNIDAKNTALSPIGGGLVQTDGQGLQTNIIIPDGATFVMGGLFNTVRNESHTGIPLLMDIPVVGNLFGTKSSDDQKTETVFFITPKVFSYKDIVTTQGVRAKDYIEGQRSSLIQEQKGLEKESQLLSMPQMKVSEDE
ncbi:MAG: hypothetical protein HQL87_00660 [Magnetococcales bacterium]|nr:hypothetical protein [Magnetococcales bacterium]